MPSSNTPFTGFKYLSLAELAKLREPAAKDTNVSRKPLAGAPKPSKGKDEA